MAELITQGQSTTIDLTPLRFSRFAEGRFDVPPATVTGCWPKTWAASFDKLRETLRQAQSLHSAKAEW